jgi:5-methylcytosine-specific restriction endonuclease McrA
VSWVNEHLATWDSITADKGRAKAEQKRCKALYLTCDPDYAWLSDPRWLEAYRNEAVPPLPCKRMQERPKVAGNRPQVPAALRAALWNDRFGEREGVGHCACCSKEVTQQCFHAGHVVSVAEGGATTLENLVVLCALCNTSMGAKSFDEFARAFARGESRPA